MKPLLRRLGKILLILLLVTVFILVSGFAYLYFHYPLGIQLGDISEFQPEPCKSSDTVLSAEEVTEDIQSLILLTEETHPCFLQDETIPNTYAPAKETLLGYCGKSITVKELGVQLSKYLSSLHDGHTKVLFSDSPNVLDVNWNYIDGKLYLLDETLSPKGEVTAIGGVPVEKIVQEILAIFPTENSYGEAYNVELYAKAQSVLDIFGVENFPTVEIQYLENGKQKTMVSYYLLPKPEKNSYTENITEDILYVRINEFENTLFFERVLKDIELAEQRGIDKYIIDVRINPGGPQTTAIKLSEALGFTNISRHSLLVRFSPLACERYRYIQKGGSILVNAKHSTVKNKENEVFVLVDESSFSAAQVFATCLQDSNAATIIGRPSRNNTSFYMNSEPVQLENSKLIVYLSTAFTGRADESKAADPLLHPDIYVEKNEDILQAALDYIERS